MSEVLENAKILVETLKKNNFQYGSGLEQGTKREFYWSELLPKKEEYKKLLTKEDVLEALGIGPNPRIEDAQKGGNMANGDIVGIWPTFVPSLNYVRVRNTKSTMEDDYFEIEETPSKENRSRPGTKKESLSQWNKRMWSQLSADELAKKELDKTGEQIKKESQ